MDRTALTQALETAKSIITSHGIMKYMRDYDRRYMPREINDSMTDLRYEFCLDPSKSTYSSDNCSCAINVYYRAGDDYDHEGGINRQYKRKVTLTYGSGEVTLENLSPRENFIKTLTMVIEMLESAIPSTITLSVKSATEVAERKAREAEQLMGEKIYTVIGWEGLRGIRTGKKPRVMRLPDNFVEMYGSLPDTGTYRYEYVRRRLRRGVIREKYNYIIKVVSSDNNNSRSLMIFRTA